MRADVQDIFKSTPHDKQVMMFSATLAPEIRAVCKKFMTNVRATRRAPTCHRDAPARVLTAYCGAAHPCQLPAQSRVAV